VCVAARDRLRQVVGGVAYPDFWAQEPGRALQRPRKVRIKVETIAADGFGLDEAHGFGIDTPFGAAWTADRTIGVEKQARHPSVGSSPVGDPRRDDLIPVGADAAVPPVARAGDVRG